MQNDLEHIYECGVQRIFRHFGLPCPTLEQYRSEVTADFMNSFYYPHGIPSYITAEDLDVIANIGFEERGRPPDLFDDAKEVIGELYSRDYTLVVVSGYQHEELIAALEHHGLTDLFASVQGSVRDKPVAFAKLMGQFGLAGREIAAIGDTTEDAEASAAIGAVPFICPRGFHPYDRLAPLQKEIPQLVMVQNLRELLPYFP
jgi:phosphoglycolate phosphatase-like HAD superfamily hydrolase